MTVLLVAKAADSGMSPLLYLVTARLSRLAATEFREWSCLVEVPCPFHDGHAIGAIAAYQCVSGQPESN